MGEACGGEGWAKTLISFLNGGEQQQWMGVHWHSLCNYFLSLPPERSGPAEQKSANLLVVVN